jgi:hypothetical protein
MHFLINMGCIAIRVVSKTDWAGARRRCAGEFVLLEPEKSPGRREPGRGFAKAKLLL